MRLTMLGTGNALVTEVYNTCFVIENENQYLLVDGGGGSEILKRLKDAKISIADIHHIFVTQTHRPHFGDCMDDSYYLPKYAERCL